MSEEQTVLYEVRGHVARLTLNRPERKNAMTMAMLDAFRARIDEVRADREVRALVVTGAGKAFCSGADLTAMGELAQRAGAGGPDAAREGIRALYDSFLTVREVDVPTIAAVNGAAVGGGLGLALLCDLRIVSETAKLGANFAKLGIAPGMGISAMLPDTIGFERAAEMLFTGELIRGAEAARLGLALRAVAADEVVPEAEKLAERIAAGAPLAVRQMKRTLRQLRRDLTPILETESYAQAALSQTEDAAEGISALIARRDPQFRGR